MKIEFCILLVAVLTCTASGNDNEKQVVEARGKAKFALLTNLAIMLAAKVGLFKICLGIALVIGSMKFLVILAWALAIFKYVPDPYIYYNSHEYQKTPLHLDHNPFDYERYGHDRFGHDRLGYDHYGHGNSVHFFYVVATKLFVLKIVYGALFYALIIKGWHFVSWFIHYLKEKKHAHPEYVEYVYEPYHDHGHHHGHSSHDYYDHGHSSHDHYGHDHSSHDHFDHEISGHDHYGPPSYDSDSYGPYDKKGHGGYKKAYDADGSYSVKS